MMIVMTIMMMMMNGHWNTRTYCLPNNNHARVCVCVCLIQTWDWRLRKSARRNNDDVYLSRSVARNI